MFVAEVGTALWLVIKGANWKRQQFEERKSN
jgi:hypothetical protein